VGDYGKTDRETGIFQKEGNIYEDATMAHLTSQHLPITGALDKTWIISSAGVIHSELTVGAEGGVAGLANASIKGQWKFGSRRGALLAMSRPVSSYVPPKVLLKHLVDIPILKNKELVTEVVSCPAYSLYLSTANNETIDLALIGTVPIPSGIPASVGAEVEATWWSRNMSGMFREACDRNGLDNYAPLYALKKIRQKHLLRRESPVPDPEDDDLWIDVQEPWDPVDSDGEEEAYDNYVSD